MLTLITGIGMGGTLVGLALIGANVAPFGALALGSGCALLLISGMVRLEP